MGVIVGQQSDEPRSGWPGGDLTLTGAYSKTRLTAMQGIDVLHTIAALTLALLFVRGAQALAEHYLPNSGANYAARFLFGGPS